MSPKQEPVEASLTESAPLFPLPGCLLAHLMSKDNCSEAGFFSSRFSSFQGMASEVRNWINLGDRANY